MLILIYITYFIYLSIYVPLGLLKNEPGFFLSCTAWLGNNFIVGKPKKIYNF
jgi:hypothetical protein